MKTWEKEENLNDLKNFETIKDLMSEGLQVRIAQLASADISPESLLTQIMKYTAAFEKCNTWIEYYRRKVEDSDDN